MIARSCHNGSNGGAEDDPTTFDLTRDVGNRPTVGVQRSSPVLLSGAGTRARLLVPLFDDLLDSSWALSDSETIGARLGSR